MSDVDAIRAQIRSEIELSEADKKESAFQYISLGGGVQSSTMFLMNLHGLIKPQALFAVFAGTQNERKATYEYLDYLDDIGKKFGFPKILRVTFGNIVDDNLDKSSQWRAIPPYFIKSNYVDGMLSRICTEHYKVRALRKGVRKIFGMIKHTCWIGFSTDEIQRRNDTNFPKYIVPRYPLLELRINRQQCLDWIINNEYMMPTKSACIICPYRSTSEWMELKDESPEEFEEACQFDDEIRELDYVLEANSNHFVMDNSVALLPILPIIEENKQLFLHRSREPLRDVDFTKYIKDKELEKEDECTGGCWL